MLKKNITQFAIFFIFLFMVVLGISSESYAWTYEQFIDYCNQLATNDNTPTYIKNKATSIKNNASTLENYIGGFSNFVVLINQWNNVVLYATNNTITNPVFSNNGNTIQWNSMNWNNYGYQFTTPNTISNNGTQRFTYVTTDTYFGLIEIPENIENNLNSNWYLQNKYEQGMEFQPDYLNKVNYESYENVNVIKANYSNIWQPLGSLLKINESHNYYTFVWLSSNGSEISRLNWTPTMVDDFTQGNLYFAARYRNLYVKSRLLYMNSIYTLAVYSSDIDYEISNAKDSQVFTYIVLNNNASVSGDTILNFGSGDNYTNQNSTNDIINFLGGTSDADNTISNFLSGDSSSFANNIGYSPITNPFVGIIENTLTSIVNILLGSGNETLTIALRDEPIVLHSENFTIPDGAIKTFITLVTNGFLVWAIIKYGFELYQWINTGRLQNLVNEANGHWYKALF